MANKNVCDQSWLLLLYLICLSLVVIVVCFNFYGQMMSRRSPSKRITLENEVPKILPVNLPTQGYYGDFRLVGYLKPTKDVGRKDHSSQTFFEEDYEASDIEQKDGRRQPMLRLYGRRIDSNRYEYYTTNHYDPEIKIDLHVPRDQELSDHDLVHVPGYGMYKAVIYNALYPSFLM